MFIAKDKNEETIDINEAIVGEEYFCPICQKQVIVKAKSSECKRPHFAHKSACLDTWKHDMTEWHYNWQLKFPKECREVVVTKDDIIHRADILINNIVIEFQNSPMTLAEFEERNTFYNSCGYNVVWVFNANNKIQLSSYYINMGLCRTAKWHRKKSTFPDIPTEKFTVFLQNYDLNNSEHIISCISVSSKELVCFATDSPILPENFLKSYGSSDNISVFTIEQLIRTRSENIIKSCRSNYRYRYKKSNYNKHRF